ncbi:hypothetical protein [Lentzea pudingi]|uniref:hypothetical protein n=1 Tax=Lentzea pudingi TaxID=1789439 RepID=UPI001664820F|nr:hypothetical protein [Lentzea pudingi]
MSFPQGVSADRFLPSRTFLGALFTDWKRRLAVLLSASTLVLISISGEASAAQRFGGCEALSVGNVCVLDVSDFSGGTIIAYVDVVSDIDRDYRWIISTEG